MGTPKRKVAEILRADMQVASGKEVTGDLSFKNFYKFSFVKPNANKLTVDANQISQLEIIRALIAKSQFEEAMIIIEETLPNASLEKDLTGELLFEKVRILAFRAEWNLVLLACNQCLVQNPVGITTLSLHQVRSIAYFELGLYSHALNDVLKIEAQASMYPQSAAVRLSKSHKVKILKRLNQNEEARELLALLWQEELSAQTLNLYYLLILARVEIDLARTENKPHLDWILLCIKLSQHIGDELYLGLALIDLWSNQISHRDEIKIHLDSYTTRFLRVEKLFSEVKSTAPQSVMAKTIQSYKNTESRNLNLTEFINEKYDVIVIQKLNVAIDLRSQSLLEEEKFLFTSQVIEALPLLQAGPIDKRLFFEKQWKMRFLSDLHDAVIRSFLQRLRHKYHLEVECKDSLINLKTKVFIA